LCCLVHQSCALATGRHSSHEIPAHSRPYRSRVLCSCVCAWCGRSFVWPAGGGDRCERARPKKEGEGAARTCAVSTVSSHVWHSLTFDRMATVLSHKVLSDHMLSPHALRLGSACCCQLHCTHSPHSLCLGSAAWPPSCLTKVLSDQMLLPHALRLGSACYCHILPPHALRLMLACHCSEWGRGVCN
jgi:hypothetical protein